MKQFGWTWRSRQTESNSKVREPDDSTQIGDCYVTKTGLTWCRGKTTKANGVKVTWNESAEILASTKAKTEALNRPPSA